MDKRIKTDMTLKTLRGPFRAVWRGQKTAELRKDDRGFQVGDRVELIEHDGGRWLHPYRCVIIEVTHTQEGFGLERGHVMLSFKVLQRRIGIKGHASHRNCGGC